MKRYRIDFSIRELGVPEEDALGVRFGDEVDRDSICDFFDRCRDAVTALFGGKRPVEPSDDADARSLAKLEQEFHRQRAHIAAASAAMMNKKRVAGATRDEEGARREQGTSSPGWPGEGRAHVLGVKRFRDVGDGEPR